MEQRPPSRPRLAWVENEAVQEGSSPQEDGAVQEGSSPSEPDEVTMVQLLQIDESWLPVYRVLRETVDFIAAFVSSPGQEHGQKMEFLHSICTLCDTARRRGLSQGLDIFCHRYDLAENIKLLLDEEPRDELRKEVWCEAMGAMAALSSVEMALEGKKRSLLEACFNSIFGLPPEEETDNVSKQLYHDTLYTMDIMLCLLVWNSRASRVSEELQENLEALGMYLKPWERTDIVLEAIEAMRDSSVFDEEAAGNMLEMLMTDPEFWLLDVPAIMRCICKNVEGITVMSARQSVQSLLLLLMDQFPMQVVVTLLEFSPPGDSTGMAVWEMMLSGPEALEKIIMELLSKHRGTLATSLLLGCLVTLLERPDLARKRQALLPHIMEVLKECSTDTKTKILAILRNECRQTRELSISLFRDLLEAVVGRDKRKMKKKVRRVLLPLFLHMQEETDSVAKLRRDRSRAEEYLCQSLPYLEDAEASVREAALRFIGLAARHLRGRSEEKLEEICEGVSSGDSEEKGDEDGPGTQKRYYYRQRKTFERYQAPLEEPRQRKIRLPGRSSGFRQRYSSRSAQSQCFCCKRTNRRRHAVHRTDSTSAASSSDDEEHFEKHRKHSRMRFRWCFPLNFGKDELKGMRKDRMRIGAGLADVNPMQINRSVRFDAVGGLSDHISALKEMVLFLLLYLEFFERFKIQPPRGCLFCGPPGTGKTLVARALANECSQGDRRVAFFMRKGADILSKWVGESEQQLPLLLDQAYQMRPSIIFFDEIDALAPVRSSKQDQVHSSIVSTLLTLMDGLDNRGEIVVVGATNRLDSVDPALRRPGCFDREFLFSLPNKENVHYQPTSCRPWFLLVGEPGRGQASHLAPAVIHALEQFPVYTLDLSVLCASTATAGETCAQLMREAQRTAPSLIYIPHIHLWWEAAGATLKATFTTLLQSIPTFAPVLLLATSDVCHEDLPKEVQELFVNDEEVFQVLPGRDEGEAFFEEVFINQAAKPPASKNNRARQTLEVLPVAPPPKPQQLTEEEIRQLEEQEEDTLRNLRIFLRDVTHGLVVDRRFRAFTKPVDPEEVPDDDEAVIKQPMDLSTVLSKIDSHQYLTAGDFLKDIDLICSNALEYNPGKDPGDHLMRHRACTLRDIAYSMVKKELDEDLEHHCEDIQESRKKRGCSSSKYAPSYYCVMPEQSSVSGGKKTDPKCHKKTEMPAAPVDSSTPRSNDMSKRKRKKNKESSGIAIKRRNFRFNKENNVPEDKTEVGSDESPEKHFSNTNHTESESPQDSSMEENENVLQERQKNGSENKSGTEHEIERVLLVAKSVSEKKRVMPEHAHIRKESEVLDCQTESSRDGDSNDSWVQHVTRAGHSPGEEQQMKGVEKEREVLTQPVIVDYYELNQLLYSVAAQTKKLNIFQLEKLYAALCQCIYRHQEDYDKTQLVK
ncbi:LOW QUALITY PROTEIN: ATPase family AAA domain-containing protein 2-like, partial [Pterocles gutturalis]